MDYMDAFVDGPLAQSGFSISYDLREMSIASMSVVTRIAEWGAQPERKEKWERLNRACRVIVPGGLLYAVCKGVLSTFFFVCPPVVRTLLLTDPDQPESSA